MHYIGDIYPLKAQYNTNEPVNICVEFVNPLDRTVSFTADIKVINLISVIQSTQIAFSIEAGQQKSLTVEVLASGATFAGFGFDLDLYENAVLIDTASTAFDVVSDWRKATRYGFLCGFGPDEEPGDDDVKCLLKFHLNLVQFYDWTFRHHDFLSPERQYSDLMGKKVSFDVIKQKIAKCHEYGMKAVAYGPVYAAGKDFFELHKDWALYNSSGEVFKFIDTFYIMNISPESPWHNHIIKQYKKAVSKAGFDGIHMDTYGFPKTGFSRLNGNEKVERLEEHLPVLINNARHELEKVQDDVCLIFNNVCNWPVRAVAKASQDAIYIEVWEPYDRYFHIQQLIENALELGDGKPVIIAAYLSPFKDYPDSKGAQNSALLLSAVIAACGGHHLLIGEKNGLLTQGYYVDHATMKADFVRVMRNYYDFIVRYTYLLYDKTLCNVSMTHISGDNMEYVFENVDYSTYGNSNKVWVIAKETYNKKIIHLINLVGNDEDYWNKCKSTPTLQHDLILKVQALSVPKSVYMASPDFDFGRSQMLEFTITDSDRGKIVEISVSELLYWNMVVMEF